MQNLQISGSNYVSLTEQHSVSLAVHEVWAPTIPDPGSYIHKQWKRHKWLAVDVFPPRPCGVWLQRQIVASGYYLKDSLHVQRQACLFFAIIWPHTIYSTYVTDNALIPILRSCPHAYMALLIAHDSVLRQQKGTEANVTLFIGRMIDIKYNHTFNPSLGLI